MLKTSKIPEKPTRIPDILETPKLEKIKKYLANIQKLQSESAKAMLFSHLLKDLFGDNVEIFKIEDYLKGVEKFVKIKEKDFIVKGHTDNFFGNLIIEFERDLNKNLGEAKKQLRKYVFCLLKSTSTQNSYICLATDGVIFKTFVPKVKNGKDFTLEDIALLEIETVDLSSVKEDHLLDFYYFLDRYFLRTILISPTTESFVNDFGIKSAVYQYSFSMLEKIWETLKNHSPYKTVFSAWEKYLRIAYGSAVANDELFLKHTYLASLIKILAWHRISEGIVDTNSLSLEKVLNGGLFSEAGIVNFLEEDFFSWVAREEAWRGTRRIFKRIVNQLQTYNIRELSDKEGGEDVLKELYQELVDPQTRHDLGEYYTPDWLAGKMVHKLLKNNPELTVLDPACGSGTFLYMAIKYKRSQLGDSKKTLSHILESVAGIDIHPLAVIVSKTNYLLALGDLLQKRGAGSITIPVYLCDSIKIEEKEEGKLDLYGDSISITIQNETVDLPKKIVAKRGIFDSLIELTKDYALNFIGERHSFSKESFLSFIEERCPNESFSNSDLSRFYNLFLLFKKLIERKEDSIWAFVVKNSFKSLSLKKSLDLIIGNPPWLVYRNIERGDYQKWIKKQIKGYWLLYGGKAELITHLELATLFFVKCSDFYLKQNGKIAFVMPKSLFAADQHHFFRTNEFRVQLGFNEIWDLESVSPLFNIPPCVIFGQKDKKTNYPLHCFVFKGKLNRKNEGLEKASEILQIKKEKIALKKTGERSFWSWKKDEFIPVSGISSYYKKFFKQGATIVPRAFWFVDVKTSPVGFNPNLPLLETSKRINKGPVDTYRNVEIKGNLESRFLYYTLLGDGFLPFGYRELRLIVLPIEPMGNEYRLLTANETQERGFVHLTKWLRNVQKEWNKRRGAKAKEVDAIGWIDYRRKLTSQNPQTKYKVLYNTATTYICSCVIKEQDFEIVVSDQTIEINGFCADTGTYYFETQNENEAFYLTTILNSPLIDKLVKPFQTSGLFGARNIHKKVLELPIPKFDPSNSKHLELAGLGKQCSQKISDWIRAGGPGKIKGIGTLRAKARELIKNELDKIDKICRQLLTQTG